MRVINTQLLTKKSIKRRTKLKAKIINNFVNVRMTNNNGEN